MDEFGDRSGGGVEGLVVIEVGAKVRAKHSAMGQRTPVVSVVRCENMEQHKRREICRAKVESNRKTHLHLPSSGLWCGHPCQFG